jgi:hypothetical protein
MQNRVWLKGVVLAVLSCAAVLVYGQDKSTTAPSTRPAGGARPPRPGGAGGMNLEASMKSMGQALKQLNAQVNDKAQNASSLTLVMQMETATVSAKSQPPRLPRASEEDRAKKQADFRLSMMNLLRQELDLEDQLLANDNTKAAATLATMEDVMKQGHEEFNVKLKSGE